MVLASVRGHCSDIVLVSGDADMIPGVQEATNAGIRVHLYGFGWDSMSSALRHACDTTTILDPREDFSDSMQLEVLEGPLPPSVRNKQDNDDMCDDDNSTPLDMEETYIQESTTITAVEVSVPTPPSDAKDSDSVSSQQSEQALPANKAADSTNMRDYSAPDRVALLLGEEVDGIAPEWLALADDIIEIPMFGQKESFNVSVAAGIALYELATSGKTAKNA